jgi:hypothetical protein
LNLLEDGLQLWLVALRNASEPSPQLLDLFPNLATAMESSTGTPPPPPHLNHPCHQASFNVKQPKQCKEFQTTDGQMYSS